MPENKYKRKLKELEAQKVSNITNTLLSYRKNWSNFSLIGGGLFINLSTLGKFQGFEAYIDGESFDKHLRPAIEAAILDTIKNKKLYLQSELNTIKEITGSETTKESK